MNRPATLGALRRSGWKSISVKDELRRNLIAALRDGRPLFPGIIGYEQTVLPQLQNAILARHDFILLGLRGQAKSRILRSLTNLLDEFIPVVAGCEINDDPYAPVCKRCRRLAEERGADLEVAWLHREERYREKLATPDVTIADLLGDIDPIKAATRKLAWSDEEVIHYGIIPRTNRGIFAINELPDLAPRIQVGLFNILEERELQIRGFPLRLPMDILLTFTANPEDYTSRGRIITPLKDRIGSQVLTHYPPGPAESAAITRQEAWTVRDGDLRARIEIPDFFRNLIEEITFEARRSQFVDPSSGVSARMSIAAMELLVSQMERRALATGEETVYPRLCDLGALVPALVGKIELVYEGEQEGAVAVARRISGAAVKRVFERHFPPAYGGTKGTGGAGESPYQEIIRWFAQGRRVEIGDRMTQAEYEAALSNVKGLREMALRADFPKEPRIQALLQELILEGLYQNSVIARKDLEGGATYTDLLKTMFEEIEDPAEAPDERE